MQTCVLGTGDSEVGKTNGVSPYVTGIAVREAGIGKQKTSLYLYQPKSGRKQNNWEH